MTKACEFYNKATNSKFDIIAEFLSLLHNERINYCVIGGVAINAYCEPLVTLDFDCVIAKDRIIDLKEKLKSKGFKIKTHPHTYEVTHLNSEVRIQIQRDNRYQEFIKGATFCKVLDYRMRVAKKEDLLCGKLWASQDKTRNKLKKEKDMLDIHRLTDKYAELKKLMNKKFQSA
ncbi:MAG: hypothetical protein AB1393_01980 [Candidatus Edwardsbacteria bacterium]